MNCPNCNAEMEYEEIKWPAGIWYCPECGKEYYGEQFACGADEEDNITDHEERIGDEINMMKLKFRAWEEIKKRYLSYKGLNIILWFGKYKGKSIRTIIDRDAQYIEWCLNKKIFRLNWFAKPYYLKRLDYQKELKRKFLIGMYELEEKYGEWMDDGQGNCGFVKKDEYY